MTLLTDITHSTSNTNQLSLLIKNFSKSLTEKISSYSGDVNILNDFKLWDDVEFSTKIKLFLWHGQKPERVPGGIVDEDIQTYSSVRDMWDAAHEKLTSNIPEKFFKLHLRLNDLAPIWSVPSGLQAIRHSGGIYFDAWLERKDIQEDGYAGLPDDFFSRTYARTPHLPQQEIKNLVVSRVL